MGMFNLKLKKITKSKLLSTRKRDVARIVSMKRVREPIPAKIQNAVKKRAKGKCEVRGCNISKYLKFHHKNMKNDDSHRLSNIVLLCSFHHDEIHDKEKVVKTKDVLGNTIKHRVVKKEIKKRIIAKKKADKKRNSFGSSYNFGI